ncbi:hypothetical protein [Mycolicibacterium phlei]|uniref:hypothetical protein n=1 Tax=Mycolicibacterium phlei TaxID=1771 RepID=UPI0002E98035|nr:hypothetical protein [Mycolicibacterium phlei]MBF4194595.1 hypothetical protein [Mycolicibacterium phlei]
MSGLIIDFPDCGEIGHYSENSSTETLTVMMDNCTPIIEGPPPLVPWWGWVLGAILLLAFIISVAVVRVKAHDAKVERQKIASNEAVALEQNRKVCAVCGADQLQAVHDK